VKAEGVRSGSFIGVFSSDESARRKAMTLFSFLILLLIAGICGAIGQAIAGFQGGLLVSIAVGFIGALIGIWLAGQFGLREMFAVRIGGQSFPIIWSIIGSALFVALIGLFRRRRYVYR
jgi:uncharacterized membrane protein YeaQ/YmgE (transglycosylase-associated protein family)